MSVYIKIKKSLNPIHNGSEILCARVEDAAKNLIDAGVIESGDAHHMTHIRRATKEKRISHEFIKGTCREDIQQLLPTDGTAGALLNERARKWMNGSYKPEQNETVAQTVTETWEEENPFEDQSTVILEHKKESKPKVAQIDPIELAKSFTTEKGDNPFSMMAQMIAPFVKPDYEFAAQQINKLVADAVSLIRPDKTEIYINGELKGITDKVHKKFKDVMRCIAVREHLWMVGAAGSGKTTIAHQAADALGLPFYAMSVGMQTTKAEIFGYTDAHSNYKQTMFRMAYENGGVFLFDEIDAGNPGVLTSINSALANSACGFPDGTMVKRHADFVCIAAANTYGRGADRQYVGRQQIDAATLDRFTVVEIDYDEELELDIAGNREWTRTVQRLRAKVDQAKARIIISPRASIKGAKLLSAGFTESQVMEMVIYKGMSASERQILNN